MPGMIMELSCLVRKRVNVEGVARTEQRLSAKVGYRLYFERCGSRDAEQIPACMYEQM